MSLTYCKAIIIIATSFFVPLKGHRQCSKHLTHVNISKSRKSYEGGSLSTIFQVRQLSRLSHTASVD